MLNLYRWLKTYCRSKARKLSNYWGPWVPDVSRSSTVKENHPGIKNDAYIYVIYIVIFYVIYIYVIYKWHVCPLNFEPLKTQGHHKKMCRIWRQMGYNSRIKKKVEKLHCCSEQRHRAGTGLPKSKKIFVLFWQTCYCSR